MEKEMFFRNDDLTRISFSLARFVLVSRHFVNDNVFKDERGKYENEATQIFVALVASNFLMQPGGTLPNSEVSRTHFRQEKNILLLWEFYFCRDSEHLGTVSFFLRSTRIVIDQGQGIKIRR